MKKLVLVLLLVMGAVPVVAQKVKVGSDPNIDVSHYKTYAWAKPLQFQNPTIQQTIVDAIDKQLAVKGLRQVETEPELTIVIWTATDSDLHVSQPSWNNAMGSSISTGIAVGSQAWPITKGTLVVDMADAGTKNSVWRATATHTLEHGPTGNRAKDAKVVQKPITKAVEKMFKQFPRPK